jgi:hypothetical protein
VINLIARYTIDRESLYNEEYSNVKIKIIKGSFDEKLKLKTPVPVIYRILKHIRKKKYKNG